MVFVNDRRFKIYLFEFDSLLLQEFFLFIFIIYVNIEISAIRHAVIHRVKIVTDWGVGLLIAIFELQ